MGIKLLLADDSITIQKVVGIIFSNEDYELTVVGDGLLAIEKAREIKPDIMLVDAIMPGRSGYEVCQEVRSDATLRHIPLLLMTGAFEPFDEGRAKECGADDFISKPFESHNLVGKVTSLLEIGRSRSQSAVTQPPAAIEVQSGDQFFSTQHDDPWNEPAQEGTTQPAAIVDSFSEIPEMEVPSPQFQEIVSFAEPAPAKIEVVEAAPGDDPWGVFDLVDLDEPVKTVAPVPSVPEAFTPLQAEETPPQFSEPAQQIRSIAEAADVASTIHSSVVNAFEVKWEPLEEEVFNYRNEELTPPGETFTVGMGEPLSSLVESPEQFVVESPSVAPENHVPEEEPVESHTASPLETPSYAQPAAIGEDQLRDILSQVSREIIEKIVWEVVPDLAESIIRDEIRKIKEGLTK